MKVPYSALNHSFSPIIPSDFISAPNLFPKAIFATASDIPPFFTADADTIFLFLIFSVIKSKFFFNSFKSGKSFLS